MLKKVIPGLLVLSVIGCASLEREIEIAVDEVPDNVMQAAQNAVEGIEIESAEIEISDGVEIYELEGTSAGKEYEIEISKSGEILEIEEEEEDK